MATAAAQPVVAARAAGPIGEPRSWVGVFFLSLVTLGIYGLVGQASGAV
jgi:hypothetical protein